MLIAVAPAVDRILAVVTSFAVGGLLTVTKRVLFDVETM
jgi:hypothetical protein